MKILSVKDSKRFFKHLAECTGFVEAVNEDGNHLTLTSGKEKPDEVPMTYMDGEIRNRELVCEKKEDCRRMYAYLVGM